MYFGPAGFLVVLFGFFASLFPRFWPFAMIMILQVVE
jgi:hypothetical protein